MHVENSCPCGSQMSYLVCCGKFIEHGNIPLTAEALMRSRYTAYTLARVDYIVNTMQGEPLIGFNRHEAEQFAKTAHWQGLTVLQVQRGGVDDDLGHVEFIARYELLGKREVIHELSEFHKIAGRWYYLSGKPGKIRVERNDPCLCQSGKKYKKCCGLTL